MRKNSVAIICLALVVLAAGAWLGCDRPAPRRNRVAARGSDADAYLSSVAATLNDLPANMDLELLPAQPILTAATSSDGKEVRAICTENPQAPDGQFNYLRSTDGNANFYELEVQPGDVVRYYVNVDEETAERGIEQRTALELRVRRLDSRDQAALIIEGGLTNAATVPQRIEIWRYSDKRMDAIRSALNRYVGKRLPPAGWEPAPDMGALQIIVERANQWLRNQPAGVGEGWEVSLMIAELPAVVRQAKGMPALLDSSNLRDGQFVEWEGRRLAGAVWLRDISQWARGSDPDQNDVQTAAKLFDWTVRNVQLDRKKAPPIVHHAWQALVYGHGSAEHRAWIFVELCRHQGIEAFLLQPEQVTETPAPLLVAVMVDEAAYVFDPQLGLPLPAGEGAAEGAVGTLAELAEDDALLRQLDLEGEAYPLTADQLKESAALLVASPLQLSRRTAQLEAALEGEDFVKFSVNLKPLAERLGKIPQIKQVSLWARPFEAISRELSLEQLGDKPYRLRAAEQFAPFAERPLLWKARVLHFQGNKALRASERSDPLAEPRQGHRDALGLYQQPSVRPSEAELAKLEPAKRAVYADGKAYASYWLGLLSYDLGNYDVAAQWFGERTLEAAPQGPWADGARYNLSRAHEAQGNLTEAVELLEATSKDAPQRHGNLVRARRLAADAEKPAPAG